MAQPLYFLSGIKHEGQGSIAPGGHFDRQALKDYGLDETFRDLKGNEDCVIGYVHGGGPEDQSGTLLGYHTWDRRQPRRVKYDESREWHKASDRVWIGINPNEPPQEEDLRRKRMVRGRTLEMQGGHYLVPKIRTVDGSSLLPANILFTDDVLSLPVKAEYVRYWEAAGDIIQWFFNADFREKATDRELAEVCVFLFGLNYRYGKLEQNLLQLIDTENLYTVMAWNISLFDYAEVQTG